MATVEMTISIRYTGNFRREGTHVDLEFEIGGKSHWISGNLREEYHALSDSEVGKMLARLWDEREEVYKWQS